MTNTTQLTNNTTTQNLAERIQKLENLLKELKKQKKQVEQGQPPKPERPMEEHITDLAQRADLNEDDLIKRTRQTTNGEKQRISGLRKGGIIKTNYKLAELQQQLKQQKQTQ